MKENKLDVLLGCEESQAVLTEFLKLGHNAYSCDLKPTSGNYPERHLQEDIIKVMHSRKWDLIIGFPPCTHLAVSGTAHFEKKRKDGRQQEAINFFMQMVNAPAFYVAVENPIGIMSKIYKKPTQIVHPYYFGDSARKSTCLWLKNLPPLFHAKEKDLFNDIVTHVDQGEFHEWTDGKTGKIKRQPKWYADAFLNNKDKEKTGELRSKTFKGIAEAMATQWSNYILNKIQ